MIYILHISDLHFIKNARSNIFEEVLINEAHQKVMNVPRGKKLLIVTGDFHNFADEDNYQNAEEFLKRLVSAMDLEMDQDVFVIPGNHDVGNDASLKSALEANDPIWKKNQKTYLSMLKSGDKDFLNDRLQAFRPYSSFVQRIGIYDASKGKDLPATSHIRCWRNKLNILHLNTCLIADGTSKTGQMTDATTASATKTWEPFDDKQIPTLVIGHNSFYDLKEDQQKDIKGIFYNKNVSAYLCGDHHQREVNSDYQKIRLTYGYGEDKTIPNLVAAKGIADGNDTYSEFGFCWHLWNEGSDEVTVEFRKWIMNTLGKTFTACDDGKYTMFPTRPKRPESREESSIFGDLASARRGKALDYSWIQISDLHLFNNSETELLSSAFRKIAEKYPISFIIVTGDLHQYLDNYEKTIVFLDTIRISFNLEKTDIYIVPGNHDSGYCNFKEPITSYIENNVENIPDCYVECFKAPGLIDCFKEYSSFINDYYRSNNPYDKPEQICIRSWKNQLNIIHINTAINSYFAA